MTGRNHRWDYHGADPYAAKHRTCINCGLAGKTYGVGAGRVWGYTESEGGRWLGSNRPDCPGPRLPRGWQVKVRKVGRRYGFSIYDSPYATVARYHRPPRHRGYDAAMQAGIAKAARLAAGKGL